MFDRIGTRKRGGISRLAAVGAAVALHAALIVVAIWLTSVKPAPLDVIFPPGPDVIRKPHGGRPGAEVSKTQRHQDRQRPSSPTRPPTQIVPVPAPEVQHLAEPIEVGSHSSDDGAIEPAPCIGGWCSAEGVGAPGAGNGREEILEIHPDMRHPAAACEPTQPIMPEQARLMSISGRVVVRYVVHADGTVSDVRSLLPESPAILAAAVEHWLVDCRHWPARLDGRPVSVRVTQMFTFRLQ